LTTLADRLKTEAELQAVHPPRCPQHVTDLMLEAAEALRIKPPIKDLEATILDEYRAEKPTTGNEIADGILNTVMAALEQFAEDLLERIGEQKQ